MSDIHQLQRDAFHGRHTVSLDLDDYINLARIGNTLPEWGVELGSSAYLGERRFKNVSLSATAFEAFESAISRMHGFYTGLIDEATTLAQQSGASSFGLVARVTNAHQPIRLRSDPESFRSPDVVPQGTPKTEWVLHPTVDLYVPRRTETLSTERGIRETA